MTFLLRSQLMDDLYQGDRLFPFVEVEVAPSKSQPFSPSIWPKTPLNCDHGYYESSHHHCCTKSTNGETKHCTKQWKHESVDMYEVDSFRVSCRSLILWVLREVI